MRYAAARYQKYQRDKAYRFYIADCARIITENTAAMSQGTYITTRFSEIFGTNQKAEQKNPENQRERLLNKLRETEVDDGNESV